MLCLCKIKRTQGVNGNIYELKLKWVFFVHCFIIILKKTKGNNELSSIIIFKL